MVTTRSSIKNLQPGKFVVIDEEPCKVLSVTTSVPGKHGGAKARLEVVGIFDNKRRSLVKPADTEMEIPIVEKRTGQVVAIAGDIAQIMDMETYETFDSKIPDELKDKLVQGGEVIYWILMGRKMLMQVKS
ncbi:translation initiation factor IF-5A [Candidatus Micrarchaeota archaeon RBG_16_36_9]|nr:MAG: translation initiation factor IF-5A [Candidatus Micrarchaeota archaeon RBG_16_36_9]